MGEVAASSVVVLKEIDREERGLKKETSVLTWESFLPSMFLRVMLVEGDDSTRQIIAALLHKCNYKVSAVSDGSKAWEMLKEKPHNIDLILTEVQLPSMSGLSLLTLIMGHETCKNIPVIMMSSQDSISIVFKCMMRGAADFLVKPIRRNELRNLWQHVWRRQNSSGLRHGCQDGPVEGKLGATSENNGASNHSSDYVACELKNKDYSEKGSDAQSSCTKPDTEAESPCLNNVHNPLQPKCSSSLAIDASVFKLGDQSMRSVSEVTPNHQVFNSTVIILEGNHAHAMLMTGDRVMASTGHRENSDMVNDDGFEKLVRSEPSREAIDLIGTIENQLQHGYEHMDNNAVKGDIYDGVKYFSGKKENLCQFSSPILELSLRRMEPNGNQEIGERSTLNHSNASAFSWYNNKTVQHSFPSSGSFTQPQHSTGSNLKSPNKVANNAVDAFQRNGEAQKSTEEDNPLEKMVFSCPQLGIIPVTFQFGDMPLDGSHTGYGTLPQPVFFAHPTAPPGPPPWSSDSTRLQEALNVKNSSHESTFNTCGPDEDHHPCEQDAVKSGYQSGTTLEKSLQYTEDQKYAPSATDQSVTGSSKCNSSKVRMKNSGCGSVCNNMNAHAAAVATATFESGNDEGFFTGDRVQVIDCQHISQREAALTKFRLKRKDRCYEKKVRYQSRKRLAEQRPRVKGQFVRREPYDSHQPAVATD